MKRQLTGITEYGAHGVYIPDDGETKPRCTWTWDKETRELRDHTDTASVVVDYVPSYNES